MKDIDAQLKKVARKVVGDAAKGAGGRVFGGPTYATIGDIKAKRAADREQVADRQRAAEALRQGMAEALKREAIRAPVDQRQFVLVHVRALRRSAAKLPWWQRPAFWVRVWRETG